MASTSDVEKQKLAEEVKGKTSALKNLIAGGVGGLCAVIVGQPFDMVSSNCSKPDKRALAEQCVGPCQSNAMNTPAGQSKTANRS